MSIERTIRYSGKEVTILWKPHLCIHSKKCWRELPAVFKPGQRPWILPDGAAAEAVIAQVHQCPSGALSLADEASVESRPYERTTVEVTPNGPLIVEGGVEVRHADGRVEQREGRCALCRCGRSDNKPFCDGSHKKVGFEG